MNLDKKKDLILNIVFCSFAIVAVLVVIFWIQRESKKEISETVTSNNKTIVIDTDAETQHEDLTVERAVDEEDRSSDIRGDIHELASRYHRSLSYRELWDALRIIDGEGDSVRLIYCRELRLKNLNGGSRGDWNREHTWAKSYGIGERGDDFTDLHAIFPCDVSNNSRRGNKFFDNETDRDSWLPPVEIRGDIARAMFYMDVRYDGEDHETIDLELTNTPNVNQGKLGMLDTLLKWHFTDPVDHRERLRNKRIEDQQGNRNPFVDNPQLVGELFGID